jgi:hypothetical protein
VLTGKESMALDLAGTCPRPQTAHQKPEPNPIWAPVEPVKVLSIMVAVLNIMVAEPCSRDWEWIYI